MIELKPISAVRFFVSDGFTIAVGSVDSLVSLDEDVTRLERH